MLEHKESPQAKQPWELPKPTELPGSPLGAVAGCGMYVQPYIIGDQAASVDRQRHIPLAIKELAVSGLVKPKGVLIVSGQASPHSPVFEQALSRYRELPTETIAQMTVAELKDFFIEKGWYMPNGNAEYGDTFFWALKKQQAFPKTEDEAGILKRTTQAEQMARIIKIARGKTVYRKRDRETNRLDESERYPLTQEVIAEESAKNTIENVIFIINKLAEWALQTPGELYDDSVGIVSSNFGHNARIYDLFVAFGFGNLVVPLSAERILHRARYKKRYLNWIDERNAPLTDLQNQERWRRGVREVAEYVIPELEHVQYPARLYKILEGVKEWYGDEVVARFGLANFVSMSEEDIRAAIEKPSRERVTTIVTRATDVERQTFGISSIFTDAFKDNRKMMTETQSRLETVRQIMQRLYTREELAVMGIADIEQAQTKLYEVENWLFGRMLAPEEWKNTVDQQFWRQEIAYTDELTRKWLQRNRPKKTQI